MSSTNLLGPNRLLDPFRTMDLDGSIVEGDSRVVGEGVASEPGMSFVKDIHEFFFERPSELGSVTASGDSESDSELRGDVTIFPFSRIFLRRDSGEGSVHSSGERVVTNVSLKISRNRTAMISCCSTVQWTSKERIRGKSDAEKAYLAIVSQTSLRESRFVLWNYKLTYSMQ